MSRSLAVRQSLAESGRREPSTKVVASDLNVGPVDHFIVSKQEAMFGVEGDCHEQSATYPAVKGHPHPRCAMIVDNGSGARSTLSHGFARSIVSNWLALAVGAAVSLAMVPLLLRSLGAFYYGLWALVSATLGYYGLLDLGISASLQRFVARYQGAGSNERLGTTYAAALGLSSATAVLVVILSIPVAMVLPPAIRLQGHEAAILARVVLIMGLSIAVAFPTRVMGAHLRGLQRYDLANLAATITILLKNAVVCVVVLRGYGIQSVALATLIASVLGLFLHFAMVSRINSQLQIAIGRARMSHVRELIRFSFSVFVRAVGDNLRFQMDSFVIGRWLGAALIPSFSVAAGLMSYFMSFASSISGPMLTVICNLDGQQREADARRFFLSATKATTALAVFVACVFVTCGRSMITLWLGGALPAAYPILVILTIGYVSDLGQGPSLHLLTSRARHHFLCWWTLAEGVVNLAMSIWLLRRYGVYGVALGTTLPMLVTKLVIQPLLVLRVAKLSWHQYLAQGPARPLAIGAAILGGWWLLPASSITVGNLLVVLISVSIAFAVSMYLVGLSGSEKQRLHAYLIKATSRASLKVSQESRTVHATQATGYLVCVIVPLFNKVDYVSRAVESVLSQSYEHFELLVIDDGSTDGSVERLGPFVRDGRLRIIRQVNAGVSAARNRGLLEMRGSVAAFLDSDDEWLPSHLTDIVDLADRFPDAGILATGVAQCSGGMRRDYNFPVPEPFMTKDYFELASRGATLVHSSSTAIRKEVWQNVGGFLSGVSFGEDQEYWARVCLVYSLAYQPRISSLYHRDVAESATRRLTPPSWYPPVICTLKDYLQTHQCDPASTQSIHKYASSVLLQLAADHIAQGNPDCSRRLLEDSILRRPNRRVQVLAIASRLPPWLIRTYIDLRKLVPPITRNIEPTMPTQRGDPSPYVSAAASAIDAARPH